MGGACSRKRGQQDDEDIRHSGVSSTYSKSRSSKWLATSFSRPSVDICQGRGKCPSLMELCIQKIREDIAKYRTFSMLPRDISQLIFNDLVNSQRLTGVILKAFRDCALQDIYLGEYPGVNDSWLDVISSQGSSLLSLDLSGSDVTDSGVTHLKDCKNIHALNFNFCDISDRGLEHLKGLRRLNVWICRMGSSGLHHLSGLTDLESINLSFTAVTDMGLRKLSRISSLKSLNLDVRHVTDSGLAALTGLTRLTHLDLFGACITDSGTVYIRNFKKLRSLEICGGGLTDAGVKNIKDLISLTQLNLSQNCNLTDKTLELISGLMILVSLNVSNSRITSSGLRHLKLLKNLKQHPQVLQGYCIRHQEAPIK